MKFNANRLLSLLEWGVVAGFVAMTSVVLFFVVRNIGIEWPFEQREFAPVSFTWALTQGVVPYAVEHEPLYANVYGPVYNLFVWPVAEIFGNGFLVHRVVSLGFLVASSALVFLAVLRVSASTAFAACGALLLFLVQIDDVSGLARPDTMALFFFLAALGVLALGRPGGHKALAASATLVALAFFTKPYFLAASLVGVVFLVARRRFRDLFFYGLWGTGLFALLFLIAGFLWKTYFINSILLIMSGKDQFVSWAHFQTQFRVFTLDNLALIGAGLVVAGWVAVRRRAIPDGSSHDGRNSLMVVALSGVGVGLAIMVFVLGPHIGNGQLYYNQLILPFLVVLVAGAARFSGAIRALVLLGFFHTMVIRQDHSEGKLGAPSWLQACPGCNILASEPTYWGSPVFRQTAENILSRERMEALVREIDGPVFAGSEFSGLLLDIQGRYWDNGMSEYCNQGVSASVPGGAEYMARCREHWSDVERRIREGEFAALLLTAGNPYLPLTRAHYRLTRVVDIMVGYKPLQIGVFMRQAGS